jgi:hypothetical protein
MMQKQVDDHEIPGPLGEVTDGIGLDEVHPHARPLRRSPGVTQGHGAPVQTHQLHGPTPPRGPTGHLDGHVTPSTPYVEDPGYAAPGHPSHGSSDSCGCPGNPVHTGEGDQCPAMLTIWEGRVVHHLRLPDPGPQVGNHAGPSPGSIVTAGVAEKHPASQVAPGDPLLERGRECMELRL